MKNNQDKNIRAKVLEIVSNRIKPNEYIKCIRTGCNNCIRHDTGPLHHQRSSEYIDRLTYSSASVSQPRRELHFCSNIFNFTIAHQGQTKPLAINSPKNKLANQVNFTGQQRRSNRLFRFETKYEEQSIKNYIQQWVQFALSILTRQNPPKVEQYSQINLPFENSQQLMRLKDRIIDSVKIGIQRTDSVVFPYKLSGSKQIKKPGLDSLFGPGSQKIENGGSINGYSPQKSMKQSNDSSILKNFKNQTEYSGSMSTLGSEKSVPSKANSQANEQLLRMLLIQSIQIQNYILAEEYR